MTIKLNQQCQRQALTNVTNSSYRTPSDADEASRGWHARLATDASAYFSLSSIALARNPLSPKDSIFNAEPVSPPCNSSAIASPYSSLEYLPNNSAQISRVEDCNQGQQESNGISNADPTLSQTISPENRCRTNEHLPNPDKEVTPNYSEHGEGHSIRGSEVKLSSCNYENQPAFSETSRPSDLKKNKEHGSSSSSRDVLSSIRYGPTYPIYPSHIPEDRTPTPPGLPSFGTTEAQTLRLIPSSRPAWFEILLRKLGSHRHRYDHRDRPTSSGQPNVVQNHRDVPTSQALATVRRALGLAQLVPVPNKSERLPRAMLPPGVTTGNTPGALIRAEDGSFVRGRFGNRISGHGIGARPLDYHPLAQRATRFSSLEHVMREIDKACQEADNRQAVSQQGPSGILEEMSRPSALWQSNADLNSTINAANIHDTENISLMLTQSEMRATDHRAISQANGPLRPRTNRSERGNMPETELRLRTLFGRFFSNDDEIHESNLTSFPQRTTRPTTAACRFQSRPAVRMEEPEFYAWQSERLRSSLNEMPAMEEMLQQQEREQGIRQAQNQGDTAKAKCDACWEWTCGAILCCWFPKLAGQVEDTYSAAHIR